MTKGNLPKILEIQKEATKMSIHIFPRQSICFSINVKGHVNFITMLIFTTLIPAPLLASTCTGNFSPSYRNPDMVYNCIGTLKRLTFDFVIDVYMKKAYYFTQKQRHRNL